MELKLALEKLNQLEKTNYALRHASSVQYVDGSTAAPKNSWRGRGEALGYLSALSYEAMVNPETGETLETILANKKKMYDMFLANMPQAKLVVCSGLPLPGRTQFWDATVRTNELLKAMCEETDRLYFMDATDAMLTDQGPEELKTSDGRYFNPAYYRMDRIHLNKKGHDVWTGLMKEMLEKIL